MSENNLEGNSENSGGANANSTPSKSESQPLGENFAETIATLQKKIDAQQGEINALKSGKDKAVDRVVKSQEETLAKLAKYLNVDETQIREAQRQSVLDDLIAERMGNKSQPEQAIQGRVESPGASVELQVIDRMLDLPANDSRVTELKLKYTDPVEYGKAALALQKSLNTQPPSPAEQLLPEGRSASTTYSQDQIDADLEKYVDLNKNRSLNRIQINILEDKLRKAGAIK